MLIRFGCEIKIECVAPTPVIALLEARGGDVSQVRRQSFDVQPGVPHTIYTDAFGNSCRRFIAPAGESSVRVDGLVVDDGLPDPVEPDAPEVPVERLPDAYLVYLLGSRYCETDLLSQAAWNLFGHLPRGWSRVQAINTFVNKHLTFDYQRASATRTAYGAFQERVGVCRDFAHLAIALCRCLNIPARYVNSYLGDIGVPFDPAPMDFSASMEVFIGGQWHGFDPRNDKRRIGRIVVARGRDATDVPLLHSFGAHTLKSFRVWADEVANDAAA